MTDKAKGGGKIPAVPSEIADAGLTVDVPFESGSADPQPLRYADLGPEKRWVPDDDDDDDAAAGDDDASDD